MERRRAYAVFFIVPWLVVWVVVGAASGSVIGGVIGGGFLGVVFACSTALVAEARATGRISAPVALLLVIVVAASWVAVFVVVEHWFRVEKQDGALVHMFDPFIVGGIEAVALGSAIWARRRRARRRSLA